MHTGAKLKGNLFMPVMTILALSLYILPAQAFFRHLCFGELANGRIDPIVSPGQASQHLHVTFGASNLGFDPTLEELLDSNCSSCSITQDHSAYWAPRMYFQYSNGTLEMVPTSGGMTVYYFTEGPYGDGSNVTAFPQNFRMIAGSSNKRAFYGPAPDPPMSEWNWSDTTQQSLMEKALGFNCLHYDQPPNEGALDYHYLRNKTFLDSTCTDGIRAELMFPSCWNGQDLDSTNHSTHIAYPNEVKYGWCPEDYPVRLPVLFYETIYQTHLFNNIDGQFVFSNGDPTGYGYHGDFICGWNEGVLQEAIDSTVCTGLNSSGLQEDCPIFILQDEGNATECKLDMPEALQDEAINYIQQLPGNIPIQSGPESATFPGKAPSVQPSAAMPSSTTLPSPPIPTPGPTALTSLTSPSSSDVLTSSTMMQPDLLTTMTTSYVSGNTVIEMIVVEEIVTVTSFEGVEPTGGLRKRHLHKHGHKARQNLF
ncbi:hypothetical protein LTR10_013802 [Elasticomyces elasticus]|uniref:DUF1996 domain-containing protein n=1 Tax=Exophiala sideris TaxID=1016849 RepID=A0ABR0JHZ5_9EURO|nr:hypothetical protein LTR10_013802 [Elasticomyces elasticus]KAK5033222.1 hypothetical protein LTS07_003523 [Exophiala sideris]KAK5042280.1 hypothetical protein LTR13_002086 [Exophiala sideris]KAK5063766.1 hypothetical protein LTR69_003531 [Exophiala sideris]KAK5185548.1 hypothetical protein LTR44_002537 [Eurotiomycetes sp. CCFEE 6388]